MSAPSADDSVPPLPGSSRAGAVGVQGDTVAGTARPGSPTDVAPGPPVERYAIVRHIASGGMGEVYEAHDRELNRRVALKKIKPELVASHEVAERFRREAFAAAQLDHPNIVSVYDIGADAGHPFFTMALIDGRSLTARVRAGGPLSSEDAVRTLIPIADAVAYAHERHIIHRDLKPDNVLVDSQGRPRVTDFGLARHLTEPGNLTAREQMLGTPLYMAPEQVRTSLGPVGPATDIYALGGVLMFLLTGRTPFTGACVPELLVNVLEQPPLLPRDCRSDVPEALNEICRRCLQKKPADRFSSAEALRDALAATLPASGSAPVPLSLAASVPSVGLSAEPAPPSSSKRKLIAVGLAALLGLLIAVVAVKLFRDEPGDDRAKNGSEPPKGEPGAPPVPNPGNNDPKKDNTQVRTDPELFTLAGHNGRVWLSFAPDNRSLVSWSDDATLRAWDATTGKPVKQLQEKTGVTAVRWSPDKKTVAVALSGGSARLWTLPDWEERVVYTDGASGISAVAFSPDGAKLAIGTDGGALKLFDVKTGNELADLVGHSDRILARGLYFTPGGTRLVSSSRDDSVRVWTVATGKKELAVADRANLWAVLPTPNPDRVVEIEDRAGTHVGRVLDLKTGKVAKEFGELWIDDYALAPDGKTLWTVGHHGLSVWDLTALKEVGSNKEARATVFAFVPGADRVLLAGEDFRDTRLMVFEVKAFGTASLRAVPGRKKPVVSLSVSPDGKLVATGDEDGTIKVWDAPALTRPK